MTSLRLIQILEVKDRGDDVSFAGDLLIYESLPPDMTKTAFELDDLRFQPQLISWDNDLSEPGVLDFAQDHQLLFGFRKSMIEKNAARLGHGFHNQDPRHDLDPGEVSFKKGFIGRDVLNGHDGLARLEFQDTVHHKERIAMGKKFKDIFDFDHFE
jgi:hypothetical protein